VAVFFFIDDQVLLFFLLVLDLLQMLFNVIFETRILLVSVEPSGGERFGFVVSLHLELAHLLGVLCHLLLDDVEVALVLPHKHEVIEVLDDEVVDVLKHLLVVEDRVLVLLFLDHLHAHQVAVQVAN